MSQNGSSISKAISRPDSMAKATGRALYIADLKFDDLSAGGDSPAVTADGGVALGPEAGLSPGMLTGRFYRSPHPRGRISDLRLPVTPEGYSITTAADIPVAGGGKNEVPMAASRDMPCFAEGEVRYTGQIVAVVAGPDPAVVDRLVNAIEMDVEAKPVCRDMDDSLVLKGGPIHGEDNVFCRVDLDRGDVDAAFASAATVVTGIYKTGFQEQFYMEGQGLITWRDGDRIGVRGSMQCPYYVHHAVSHVLGLPHDGVRVIVDTVGGAFGGKEDYPEIMGAPMAVASWVTGKPIRMLMDRVEDLAFTSKRHPSVCSYRTALDEEGNILAMDVKVDVDGGAYESYTKIVLLRAVFHSLGVYDIPMFRVRGRGIATNTVPSGAFRGFGAPQSLFGLEMHMEEVARKTGVEVLDLKKKYFLKKGDSTVTGGTFRYDIILDKLVAEAEKMSAYSEKRARFVKGGDVMRGIGMSFILHGCGFTGDGEQKIIKGEVALEKHADGTVEIQCAAVDFGQGPLTTFRKVVAQVLDLDPYDVIFRYPDTDRVPDSGPTVASRTMMVVGYLIQKAAEDLKSIWKDGEEQRVDRKYEMPPGMNWDQDTLVGDSYSSYGWGVNVCEVEVDPLTWETRVTGAWAVFDVGRAIDQKIVDCQIQGGMNQALGYGAIEKLEVDENGLFRQITMSDYMVPTSLDFPRTGAATVDNPYPYGPFGAKGMGEMVHDAGHAAFAAAVEQAVNRSCPEIPLVPETLMDIMEDGR
ncbi:MAG: xanthine dehydrogenase family protein [Spirochaetaceae bacterium]|nr:xanthine dehydrogenase family protein [Spirochaetaceae bacterium]